MKKIVTIILTMITSLCIFTSCSQGQEPKRANTAAKSGQKILIVYLSRTNNTKTIAEIIQKNLGGTLVSLELEKPYPQDYQKTVAQVQQENESGYLPPLKTKIDSIGKYDLIFVGFPTWGMKLPPPIKTFLSQYNLKGKTIVPFNSNAGYGIGSSFDQLRQLCPECKITAGFSSKGGLEKEGQLLMIKGEREKVVASEVLKWLQSINML